MERGSSKHGPRHDDALAEDLAGQLGPGGSNREEWADPEPPADDDPPARTDLPGTAARAGTERADQEPPDGDDAGMDRLLHDMAVANDWNPAGDAERD